MYIYIQVVWRLVHHKLEEKITDMLKLNERILKLIRHHFLFPCFNATLDLVALASHLPITNKSNRTTSILSLTDDLKNIRILNLCTQTTEDKDPR